MINNSDILQLERMLVLHSRAMAAHCECMGMNSENSLAVCRNETPPYNDSDYNRVLYKWGLCDVDGLVKI